MEAGSRLSPIKSFHDLEVYRDSYSAGIEVCRDIVPRLSREEKYDLSDQLRRSAKATPRLIAEGYAKRHQHRGFQKYLDDALAETNETIVGLYQVRDLYLDKVDAEQLSRLIETYERLAKQIYRLAQKWQSFPASKPKPIIHSP